ncbi:NUDIX domain-containing protein [Streptomyces sp. NPDC056549]|uniref:NUDIX domain-containing protein n=1 Tax=Streptomyces sp. NPDC056549 TaxID=3345864 RepID=UPI0036B36219
MKKDLTVRVERMVREWVAGGSFGPGEEIPFDRGAAEKLGIGCSALRKNLAKLASEGVLQVQENHYYLLPEKASEAAPHQEPEQWRIHGERSVYANRWINLCLVDVEPPGMPRFEHHVIRMQRVAITAVLDQLDRVLMLWRYRFVLDQWGWELPGGIVEAEEDAATCASREVEEETGWRPGPMHHAVTFQPMVGMVDSPHEVFVARDAEYVGEPTDAEEAGVVEWIPLADIPSLMKDGKLMGSGTFVALLHLLVNQKDYPWRAK